MSSQQPSQGSFSLPRAPDFHSSAPGPPGSQKKPWRPGSKTSLHSSRSRHRLSTDRYSHSQNLSRTASGVSTRSHNRTASQPSSDDGDKWWKIRFFEGMSNDIKRRAPYYWSDWKDAWDYRVVPATIYMYFAKYDPNECCFPFILPVVARICILSVSLLLNLSRLVPP